MQHSTDFHHETPSGVDTAILATAAFFMNALVHWCWRSLSSWYYDFMDYPLLEPEQEASLDALKTEETRSCGSSVTPPQAYSEPEDDCNAKPGAKQRVNSPAADNVGVGGKAGPNQRRP